MAVFLVQLLFRPFFHLIFHILSGIDLFSGVGGFFLVFTKTILHFGRNWIYKYVPLFSRGFGENGQAQNWCGDKFFNFCKKVF